MAKPTIIYVNDEDKIVLTKEELNNIINESYNDGYKDGNRDAFTPYRTITIPDTEYNKDMWTYTKITC